MSSKNFFNGKNSVKSATVILVITLFLSNILGLLRDHFLAQKIPTSILDTYYAAFRIPDLIFNILILGAITSAFIPVFTSYISHKKEQEAWQIASSVLNIAVFLLIIAAVLLFFLLPYLIPILVPKFDAERLNLTLQLARIFLLSPLLFGISYILGGVLNSFKRFLVYSLAPLVYNLSIILATFFLTEQLGIFGVAYGVVIGAGLHVLVQVPTVIKLGFRYQIIMLWQHPAIRKVARLMIPRAIALGAMQVMLVVYTAIASTLAPGSVAIFNLADNIQTMPTVVFGTSFATAVFPTLSEYISLGKITDFTHYIWRGIRTILFILVPAAVIFILLRAQIVRIVLGSGFFGWEQTVNTADTLAMFAISLGAQGLVPLLARAYFAHHNTKTPTIISIISIILSIILGFILVKFLDIMGLALAFSVGSFFNVICLYLVLRKKMPEIKTQEKIFWVFLIKILLAAVVMAILMQISKYAIEPYLDLHYGWGILTQALVAMIIGLAVYLGLTNFFKCEEIQAIKEFFLQKLGSSSKN